VHRGLAIGCPVLSMHSDEADIVSTGVISRAGRDTWAAGGYQDLVLSPPEIREEAFRQLFAWAARAVT